MAKTQGPYSGADEQRLMTELWSPEIADDPEAFVMFAFPWGKAGTPLEHEKGPREWQRKRLRKIRDHILENRLRGVDDYRILQTAVSSGRGIGKSALVAWLVLWMLSTKLGSTVIVTANTEPQLKTKTWPEIGKWLTLSINSHWFEITALSIKPTEWFERGLKDQLKVDTGYYYAQALLWSEDNPDAFAGAHNPNGIMLIFDEASGIAKNIWGVSKGFFTEKKSIHRYWFAFSNPRRNTGSFYECFHRNKEFWDHEQIDARTVEDTDPQVYAEIIKEHGEDSYDAKVEIYGKFPDQAENQFISRSIVEAAMDRDLVEDRDAPVIMGVDPARFGDDRTVIRFRQGRNARFHPPVVLRGKDNMEVSNICAELINKVDPDAVCIDAGNGTGIIDRLRELGFKVHEVWFGSASPEKEWANMRTYLWAKMREWLKGACIDASERLVDDLVGPQYQFMGRSDQQMLEPKESMKKRGLSSPDDGDALACTFFVNPARKDINSSRSSARRNRQARDVDYSIFNT